MKIKLGSTVKDVISGFAGVVTGRAEYITGCNQLLVQPPLKKDGELANSAWWDEDRLELLAEPEQSLISRFVKSIGSDMPAPRHQ